MPLAAPLVLALALASARAEIFSNGNAALDILLHNSRALRALDAEPPAGCLYEGRWFVSGAPVATRDACLRCSCARGGALACARRACAAPPARPPARCHLRHRRGACCPELHCPDGVTLLEHGAAARQELDDYSDVAAPASARHACVSGGAVFAAGSALETRVACEQCFCLGGARRCVRPRCLPAPRACRPRPAPGACCPTRYYCDPPDDGTVAADSAPSTTLSPHRAHTHDCKVSGKWVSEGERVPSAAAGADECSSCFCLRGEVSCAPAGCAPPLHGCTPLLRAGQCCPHQYRCDHPPHESAQQPYRPISDNALIVTRNDDRSFHSTKPNKQETTTKIVSSSIVTTRHDPAVPSTKQQHVSTTKVKRKTNDPPPTTVGIRPRDESTKSTVAETHKLTTTAAKLVASTIEVPFTEEPIENTTEQPEGSVNIMINGTINCTAEISSLPLNTTSANDVNKINLEAQPRVPLLDDSLFEAHTSNPNDIITDRNVNEGFDENETFTINVTSSLRTNTSHSTSAPSLTTISKGEHLSTDLTDSLNISKKTKEDYDYDYAEPSLPPSLPNLKIIPFVAADAVVEEDAPSKQTLTYPLSEREDKFPVYYPSIQESKVTPFATRRGDIYHPTQYPVFINDKVEAAQYPILKHEMDLPSAEYPARNNDALTSSPLGYTATAALSNHAPEGNRIATNPPIKNSIFELKTPSVNLFSPPIETEGGFVPKAPGIHGEYYAVYPSTPSAPSVPHLTTSMQLDIGKGEECISGEGQRVAEGDSVSLVCSECRCARGVLRCTERACPAPPPGCMRRPAASSVSSSSSADLCCGDLVCQKNHKTTQSPTLTTYELETTLNETKVPMEIKSEILLFDPPPDRSVPVVNHTVSDKGNPQTVPSIKNDTELGVISQNSITVETVSDPNNNTVVTETTTNDAVSSESTEKPLIATSATTTAEGQGHAESNDTKNESQEYEDDDEDEGFSLGSVLKLLLSDSYDSTTASPYKKKLTTPTTTVHFTTPTSTPAPKSTTRRIVIKPTIAPFVPMPHHPYSPPKKALQNTVNRIDHLVLGEATAIKKTTARPASTPFKPVTRITTPFKTFTVRTTSPKSTTTRFIVAKEEDSKELTSVRPAGPLPGAGGGVGGLLKLAGCNIYGRMYRVGRIIAELSSPCLECRCTELGVQCQALRC